LANGPCEFVLREFDNLMLVLSPGPAGCNLAAVARASRGI
jgi:hypothetical protein